MASITKVAAYRMQGLLGEVELDENDTGETLRKKILELDFFKSVSGWHPFKSMRMTFYHSGKWLPIRNPHSESHLIEDNEKIIELFKKFPRGFHFDDDPSYIRAIQCHPRQRHDPTDTNQKDRE